jgi:hypothetical protein
MLTREELHVAPTVKVGITRPKVVVEMDQVPRRTTLNFTNEVTVSRRVDYIMSCVEHRKVVVPDLLIIQDQDSHAITPHSLGPMV